MEQFTTKDFDYINEPFNFYDKKYIKWLETIETKKTESDILGFREKQRKNIIELEWKLLEKGKL